jgi:HTH-type transcriptional regulator/antitoxin HipB
MDTPVNTPKELGGLIRKRRRELGLSQTDLAEHAGTGVRLVSELEGGKPTAQLDGMYKIAAALGIRLMGLTR